MRCFLILAAVLTQNEPDWPQLRAHGFVVESRGPMAATVRTERWPEFGVVQLTSWELHTPTAEQARDTILCVTAHRPQTALFEVLHENFCRSGHPGQLRWDDAHAATRSRECLRLVIGPDGARRELFRIVPVGQEVCVVASSERVRGVTDQASIEMAHFVGSFRAANGAETP